MTFIAELYDANAPGTVERNEAPNSHHIELLLIGLGEDYDFSSFFGGMPAAGFGPPLPFSAFSFSSFFACWTSA